MKTMANTKFSFSGHETFVFRYGWIKKAVDAVLDNPETFQDANAIVKLGVGKNMVASIRHWALATHMLEEQPKTRGNQINCSELGRLIFGQSGHDPYLEDPNTLWVLHWNILANSDRCTTVCVRATHGESYGCFAVQAAGVMSAMC